MSSRRRPGSSIHWRSGEYWVPTFVGMTSRLVNAPREQPSPDEPVVKFLSPHSPPPAYCPHLTGAWCIRKHRGGGSGRSGPPLLGRAGEDRHPVPKGDGRVSPRAAACPGKLSQRIGSGPRWRLSASVIMATANLRRMPQPDRAGRGDASPFSRDYPHRGEASPAPHSRGATECLMVSLSNHEARGQRNRKPSRLSGVSARLSRTCCSAESPAGPAGQLRRGFASTRRVPQACG
jgi:hypothetical protein